MRNLGSGDDRVNAENGQRNVINCGPGTDTAFVDERLDSFVNRAECENIS